MRKLLVILAAFFIGCASGTPTLTIDGQKKVISTEGTFEEVCKVTKGYWWMAEMDGAMAETIDGSIISENACNGCMPNKDTMLCSKEKYLNYVKVNGVKTEGFEDLGTGSMEDMKSTDSTGNIEIIVEGDSFSTTTNTMEMGK